MKSKKKFTTAEMTEARRSYIEMKLRTEGILSYTDLDAESKRRRELCDSLDAEVHDVPFPVSYQSLLLDVREILVDGRFRILKRHQAGRIVLFLPGGQQITTKELRRSLNAGQKRAISCWVGGLLLGQLSRMPGAVPCISKELFARNADLVQPVEILEKLKELGYSATAGSWARCIEKLVREIPRYWESIARRIVIDNGSTIDTLAEEVLAHTCFKGTADMISSFEVCTNSRSVYHTLGDPNVHVRTLIVGGFQEGGTEAICGHLAETFLELSNLSFAVAIVGATVVDLNLKQFGSDHYRDGVMKQKFLERSNIRIVVADSSKFSFSPMTRHHRYCAISPDCVDFIVTDSYAAVMKALDIPEEERGDPVRTLIRYCPVPILEAGEGYVRRMAGMAG